MYVVINFSSQEIFVFLLFFRMMCSIMSVSVEAVMHAPRPLP